MMSTMYRKLFAVDALRGLAGLARSSFFGDANGVIQHFTYLVEAGGRNNNGISSSSDILRHLQEPPPWIFPEFEGEELSFDLNLLSE